MTKNRENHACFGHEAANQGKYDHEKEGEVDPEEEAESGERRNQGRGGSGRRWKAVILRLGVD